jgi:3-oxoacyl-ACP reductase-like protein
MRAVVSSLLGLSIFCTSAWAVEPAPAPAAAPAAQATTATPPPQTLPANKPKTLPFSAKGASNALTAEENPLTAEQLTKNKALQDAKIKALVKDQHSRLQQLEKANLDALAQNQELQLKSDNLGVQVQVLQSERSAQMFLYGAATIAVGVLLGFLIASYVYTKRRRQW